MSRYLCLIMSLELCVFKYMSVIFLSFIRNFWCRIHLWFLYVGGFVRKVDDVTAYLAAQPSRLRAHHRNITTTRWRLCVTILHLQQYSRRLNLFLFFIIIFCAFGWNKKEKLTLSPGYLDNVRLKKVIITKESVI